MYKQIVYRLYNQGMKKTRAMHATAQRLYLAAETMKKITRPKALADLLGIGNQQTLNNWEKRGVSAEGMLLAQEKIGCNATWIESGKGEMSL
ncbi:MAG: helix-turn-helix domain containing protein, partial [Betaproteobacteria bacterium]|nr:helix-turn-helix domain containing protein [Betaproteobacteria bacterium]